MNRPWVSRDVIQPDGVYEALHWGLTVTSIQTPANEFVSCEAEEQIGTVLDRAPAVFDYLPVLDGTGEGRRIIGLLPAHCLREHRPSGTVRSHIHHLDENWVVGADASIKDFVISADRHPCRLVISGASITGLVSLSDLQRLPVRAALFALITGFEMAMADRIRREFNGPAVWRTKLSDGRREKLDKRLADAQKRDDIDDELLFTEFCDKSEICVSSFAPEGRKNSWRNVLKSVQDLRDDLAHANDYAPDREKAAKVCQTVRDLLDLLEELTAPQTYRS